MNLIPEIRATIYYLTEGDGGRKTPISNGYRGQFYFNGKDWDACQTFINKDKCLPGEDVDCYLTTLSPQCHIRKLYLGKEFEAINIITKQQIKIYLKYQNIDFFTHNGSIRDKNILSDDNWRLIDNLIQDIHILKNNLVSLKMREEIENRIQEYTEGDSEITQKLFLIK